MRYDQWKMNKLDAFTIAYLECAIWSSTDSNDVPLDRNYSAGDIEATSLEVMARDCERFQTENAEPLWNAGNSAQNGHDFWLTRNRHGAGFWDRGYGEPGKTLTNAAHAYGESDLHVGDDGLLHVSPLR